MKLFRVCPWDPRAERGEPGHPLHVPKIQGAGRVDNPALYAVLYASDAPSGAIAERYGNLGVWSEAMLSSPPALPRARPSLVEYDALRALRALDLDDPGALASRSLRPSAIVTRDRSTSQAWAARIFEEGRWSGVRWWSFYDSRWGSFGLWSRVGLRVVRVEPLVRRHPALEEAAHILDRPIR